MNNYTPDLKADHYIETKDHALFLSDRKIKGVNETKNITSKNTIIVSMKDTLNKLEILDSALMLISVHSWSTLATWTWQVIHRSYQ